MKHHRRQRRAPELMDSPTLGFAATARALSDLERINRWTLGLMAARRALGERLIDDSCRLSLLDVGTGSGQVAAALARDGHRRGIEVRVIGLDFKLSHLVIGRERGHQQLRVVASSEQLPFRSGAVDWSLSNLLFHHFDEPENQRILAEMRRVCRRGVLVVDLRKSFAARWLARLLLPLLGAGSVAFYDGKLSVDQAWSLERVGVLIDDTRTAELRKRFPFRFSLVLEPASPDPGRDDD
jgi:SAM-dependent methyltransferase